MLHIPFDEVIIYFEQNQIQEINFEL